jgi:hypothetical protein
MYPIQPEVEGTVVKLSHTAEDIKLLASIAQYTIASLALLVVIVLPVSCWLAGKWLPGCVYVMAALPACSKTRCFATIVIHVMHAETVFSINVSQRFVDPRNRPWGRGGRRGRCISKFGCYVVVPLTLVVGSVLVLYTVTAFAINVAIADACVLPDQKIPAFILESDFLYSAFSSACDGPIQSIIQKITGVLGSIMGVVNVVRSLARMKPLGIGERSRFRFTRPIPPESLADEWTSLFIEGIVLKHVMCAQAAGIGSFIAGFFKVCGDGSKDWGDVIKSVNSDLQALVKSVCRWLAGSRLAAHDAVGSAAWRDRACMYIYMYLYPQVDGLSESTFCLGLQALYSNDIYQSLCHKTGTSLLVVCHQQKQRIRQALAFHFELMLLASFTAALQLHYCAKC